MKELRKGCKPIEMEDVPAFLGLDRYESEKARQVFLNYFPVENREDESNGGGDSEVEFDILSAPPGD
jgi:hypothetical protein